MSWQEIYNKIPAPKSNACEKCNVAHCCDRICPARAKWRDVQMEKVRKALRGG